MATLISRRSIAAMAAVAPVATIPMAATSQPVRKDGLRTIIDRGMVQVGTLIDYPPFGMTDNNGKPMGFDTDLANMLANDLGVKLEQTPVTGGNRLPYLITHKVDIIIASFGATPERAKQVAFSSAYATHFQGVYGDIDVKVKSVTDLGNYRIAVARGTSQDLSLTKMAPKANIIRFEDEATAAAAFISGQTDLLACPDLIFNDVQRREPSRKMDRKFLIKFVANHIGLRQGEPELLRWLDTFVFYRKVTGDLAMLHEKWLHQKMPNIPSM